MIIMFKYIVLQIPIYVPDSLIVSYLLVHLLGVSSACTNNVLYGLLNYNFITQYNIVMDRWKDIKNRENIEGSVQVINNSGPVLVLALPTNSSDL